MDNSDHGHGTHSAGANDIALSSWQDKLLVLVCALAGLAVVTTGFQWQMGMPGSL